MEEYKGKKYYNWYEVVVHQQALIDELVGACKTAQKWFDERNIHTAVQLQLDLEQAIAKAEKETPNG